MGRVVGLYPLLHNRMSVERDESGELVYTYTPIAGWMIPSAVLAFKVEFNGFKFEGKWLMFLPHNP